MAFALQYVAEIGFADARKKATSRQFIVDATVAEAWLTALDNAARVATTLGQFLEDVSLHSGCEVLYFGVSKRDVEDTIAYPSDESNIFNFDQFAVSYSVNGRARQFTIPGRQAAAVNMASDGITVQDDTGGTTTTQDMVGAISSVLVSEVDASAATYNKMTVRA